MKAIDTNTRKEGTMTRIATLILLSLALSLGACAPTDTVSVDGPVPVTTENGDPMGNLVLNYDAAQCNPKFEGTDRDECAFDEMCVLDATATAKFGVQLFTCVTVCHAEFVENADGTVDKGEDSCQRLGDEDWFCNMEAKDGPECVKYAEVPNPCANCGNQEPETPVEPTPAEFVEVSCCFNTAHLTDTMYAQLAWSTSSPENPENFGKDGDLELDSDGCFTSNQKVERAKLYLGFWTELTDGKVQYLDENGDVANGQWLGTGENNEFVPLSCTVDGAAVTVGGHMANCGFGFDDATNVSCLN